MKTTSYRKLNFIYDVIDYIDVNLPKKSRTYNFICRLDDEKITFSIKLPSNFLYKYLRNFDTANRIQVSFTSNKTKYEMCYWKTYDETMLFITK